MFYLQSFYSYQCYQSIILNPGKYKSKKHLANYLIVILLRLIIQQVWKDYEFQAKLRAGAVVQR